MIENIYITQTLRIRVLYWYHLCINHTGGSILAETIREVCYWKVLVTQSELHAKPCKICQQFKNRKTIYGNFPPDNIAELKLLGSVRVYLIVPCSKSQQQP